MFENPNYILAEFKSIAVLSKQEYPGAGVRQSLFSQTEQPACLKLYNEYQNHLQTKKLVHPHFYEFNTVVPEYNGVIFDELPLASVQCVLQVLRFLAAEPLPPFIYLLGDPLQNNANHHSIIDLMQRKIQEKYNIKIKEHQLETTYRNPPSVTKLANHVMEIRRFSNRGIHDTNESRILCSGRELEADTLPVDWRYGVNLSSLKEKLNRPNASLLDLMNALDNNRISSALIKSQLQELKVMLLSLKEELNQPFVMLLTTPILEQQLNAYFNALDQKATTKSSRVILSMEQVQGLQARKVIVLFPLDDVTEKGLNTEIKAATPEELAKNYLNRPTESGRVSPHLLKLSSLLVAVTRATDELVYITTAPHKDNSSLLNALQNGLHANPDTKHQVSLQALRPSPQSNKLHTWADWEQWILTVYKQLGKQAAEQTFDNLPQNIKTLASAKTFSQFEIQHQLKSAPSSTPLTATAAAAATVEDIPRPVKSSKPAPAISSKPVSAKSSKPASLQSPTPVPAKGSKPASVQSPKPASAKTPKILNKGPAIGPNSAPKAAAPTSVVQPVQNHSERDVYLSDLLRLLKSKDAAKKDNLINLFRHKAGQQFLFDPFTYLNANNQPERSLRLIVELLCSEELGELVNTIIKERPTLARLLNPRNQTLHILDYLFADVSSPSKHSKTQILTLLDLLLQCAPEVAEFFNKVHLEYVFESFDEEFQGLGILSKLFHLNPKPFEEFFKDKPISGFIILSLLKTPEGCQLLIDLKNIILKKAVAQKLTMLHNPM